MWSLSTDLPTIIREDTFKKKKKIRKNALELTKQVMLEELADKSIKQMYFKVDSL